VFSLEGYKSEAVPNRVVGLLDMNNDCRLGERFWRRRRFWRGLLWYCYHVL